MHGMAESLVANSFSIPNVIEDIYMCFASVT